jgi:hypothetical protein
MKTSETIGKISAALLEAQQAITFASKDATNPHFHSKYADLPSVIDAVKPALNKCGIVFIQSASPSEPGTLALSTRLIHVSGEWLEDTAVMPLQKLDPQGFGSAMTYARRYSLAAFTGLYQDDDDGNAASVPAKQEPTMPRAVTPQAQAKWTPASPARRQEEISAEPHSEPLHANVEKVINVMGGQVMGDPNRPVSPKQIAKVQAMLNARKVPDAAYRNMLETAFRKTHTNELTNGEVSLVYNWIEIYRP